jgi:hypothetical protein
VFQQTFIGILNQLWHTPGRVHGFTIHPGSLIATKELFKKPGKMYVSHHGGYRKRWTNSRHTHNPLDDAIGNAEALLRMKHEMGLKISLK